MTKNPDKIYISVDIEADGPAPGEYSMVQLGAVVVEDGLKRTFLQNIAPISKKFNQAALSVSHMTRQQTLSYESADAAMKKFVTWLDTVADGKEVVFMADNGFDWGFVNYYLWKYSNKNPLGHSDFNLTGFVRGIYRDPEMSVRQLRHGELTHNALQDAKDNADVYLRLKKNGFKPLP
jgi:DNA polymerase III epsilon subunit-like protein